MENSRAVTSSVSPSLALRNAEPFRATLEYESMSQTDGEALPEGDGHPVILIPGLASDERALLPLRNCCEALGYAVYDWQQGFNLGPHGDTDEWLHNLAEHVRGVATLHSRRVSLVGWSLGGFYAREIAKLRPPLVRQVLTLGTPFAREGQETQVAWLYRLVNGRASLVDEQFSTRLCTTPPVPTTSIYNRADGVVAWQTCLLDGSFEAEDVQANSSHAALPWSPQVLRIVADRLGQPEGPGRPATSHDN
jgi:pimeloyl-ACP methyl ester carboxylesterase